MRLGKRVPVLSRCPFERHWSIYVPGLWGGPLLKTCLPETSIALVKPPINLMKMFPNNAADLISSGEYAAGTRLRVKRATITKLQ